MHEGCSTRQCAWTASLYCSSYERRYCVQHGHEDEACCLKITNGDFNMPEDLNLRESKTIPCTILDTCEERALLTLRIEKRDGGPLFMATCNTPEHLEAFQRRMEVFYGAYTKSIGM
jgi:hypothetical protein